MEGTALQDRTDTKFILDRFTLLELLAEVRPSYRMLEVDGVRLNRYETLYYDTPQFEFYHLHQNGKKNRYKVRNRKYIDSDLAFLEVKFKNNKGRTIKTRVVVDDFDIDMGSETRTFIEEASGIRQKLIPALWNSFTRLTLVSQHDQERLTIDLGLAFRTGEHTHQMQNLVILEVKQPKASRNSVFMRALKEKHIRPERISKYCLGMALLREDVKKNSFKEKILKIEKLEDGAAA
ncbi:MAG: polyphosphate polymerase domain-containing protein [Flavobacteriales bacterium]|nr:polyphosphate polymerase domain-containing protein [Flavobacteriales bacterium]